MKSDIQISFPTLKELEEGTLKQISSGSKSLDNFLEGGLLPSQVIEIVGEAGTGKTQLCLQISLNYILQNFSQNRVVYISTKKRVNAERLEQLSGIVKRLL